MHIDYRSWLIPEPHPRPNRPNITIYSSCHCWSIIPYFREYRPEIAARFNITAILVHLAREVGALTDPRFIRSFSDADFIVHHPLDGERWNEYRIADFPLKLTVQAFTMESPQCSAGFPVVHGLEQPHITRLLEAGASTDQIIADFDAGILHCDFPQRWAADQIRMTHRDEHTDLKAAAFVIEHWRSTKMFFTHNHPTMHVIAHMMDQFFGLIGERSLGVDHALSCRTDCGQGDNHFPETQYERDYFQFTYPIRWPHTMGGPEWYRGQIRAIAAQFNGP